MADKRTPPAMNPLTSPEVGYELCYECRGDRMCLVCEGTGTYQPGERCTCCHGARWCIVCNGAGQLRASQG